MSRPKGRLSRKTFETVVGKIRRFCGGERYSLSFSGMGEPLLHPEIFDFIRSVSSEARTSFASNGSALTEENVRRLIESGLDEIYLSFNGADPATYERMMGGLKFERALHNLRRAIALTAGTRLKISANISVTKANRHQLTEITELLQHEGMAQPSYAMAHTRGGNLRDPEVVDTPPIPTSVTHCEVVRNTLFIDWRGKVLICDHDLHAEHTLGDLVDESLETIQERRQKLIDQGVHFKICGICSDVLKMGTDLFTDLRSGTLRDWIYDVYRKDKEEALLPDGTPNQVWLYKLYEKENRVHRMVNGLLKRNKLLEAEFHEAQETITRLNRQARASAARVEELAQLALERESRIHDLDAERKKNRSFKTWKLVRCEAITRRWWTKLKASRL